MLVFAALSVQDVFVSGTDGFDTFRIPALAVASDGSLLAFAEGRASLDDQAGNKIVLRRRRKGAEEWSPLQIVASDEAASLNNPCVLTLPHGRVLLMYQRYPAGRREATAPPGLDGPRIMRCFLVESRDDGKTWDRPRDITTQAKRDASVRTLASGPGVGIRLTEGKRRGRLVFPFNERAGHGWDVFALFSDDGGKTWKAGSAAPKPPDVQANEVQMAEGGPDGILLNARNQDTVRERLQAISSDGGETWSEVRPVAALPDPACMGSLIGDRRGALYFANPADRSERRNGTIYSSRDFGATWVPFAKPGESSFGYSCLALSGEKTLFCLYETERPMPDGRRRYVIRLAEFPIPQSSDPSKHA